MKYAYPVTISQDGKGYYLAKSPDLPGVVVGGESLPEVLQAATDACAMWLADAEKHNEPIPSASVVLHVPEGSQAAFVLADTDDYRRRNESYAVKKTLTIPAWMAYEADQRGFGLSQILQDALRERLGVTK